MRAYSPSKPWGAVCTTALTRGWHLMPYRPQRPFFHHLSCV